MFTHLKEANVPAGPLAGPVTMYQVGRGKIHATATCRRAARPVDVVLWDLAIDQVCAQCATDENLPHRPARNRRNHLWRETLRLRETPRPTDLSADAVHLPHAFWSKVQTTLDLLAFTRTHTAFTSRETHDVALEHWREDVYLPRAVARLNVLLEEFRCFANADWPLRYAAIAPLGFNRHPSVHIVGPTPCEPLRPGTADHAMVTELRNGMLYKWLESADVPDHDALVGSALDAVNDWTSASYTAPGAADEMARILLDAHVSTIDKAETVYQWSPKPRLSDPRTTPPPVLLALLSQAQVIQPLESGGIVVIPRSVIDVLARLGSSEQPAPPTPWSGAIYGPAEPGDAPQTLLLAATLREKGFPHREALELARVSELRAVD